MIGNKKLKSIQKNRPKEIREIREIRRYRHDILNELMKLHGYTVLSLERKIAMMGANGEIESHEVISYPTIKRCLDGDNTSVDSLRTMAFALGVEPIRLFDFDDLLIELRDRKAS